MKAVVQRALDAQCVVDGNVTGSFEGEGLVVLLGVTHDDTPEKAEKMARKIAGQRIFHRPDTPRGEEKSALDLGVPVLLISQFTLYGDTRRGNRPSWSQAAPGHVAEPLVDAVAEALTALGVRVERGIFGADMKITFTNDGPFTILIDV